MALKEYLLTSCYGITIFVLATILGFCIFVLIHEIKKGRK